MNEKKDILLGVYEGLGQARASLEKRDYAVFQGALTVVYNSLGGFVQSSMPLPEDRRVRLTALNEFVFDTRERIVNQIEVKGRDLETAISMTNSIERVDLLKELLGTWIKEWYKT